MEEEEQLRQEQEQKRKEEIEIEKYGRQWIWQGYIGENRKENWIDTAETMRHINEHVLQDIQDFILIQAYGPKMAKDRKAINEKVEGLLEESEGPKVNEDKKQLEEIKLKRKFEMMHRPPYVWNFFETRTDKEIKMKMKEEEEDKKEKTVKDDKTEKPYLINAFANPEECYKNEEAIQENRVKKVLKELDSLTYNLKNHEEAKWKTLTKLCIEIFKE